MSGTAKDPNPVRPGFNARSKGDIRAGLRGRRGRMTLGDGVIVGIASLWENKLRTTLTLLGVAIGVTAVILVVSFTEGMNGYIGDAFSDLGSNAFVVTRFGIIKSHEEWTKASRRNPEIHMDDARAVRRRARLAGRIGVSVERRSKAKYRSRTLEGVRLRGITQEVLEIEPFDVAEGRILSRAEVDGSAHVCFIGMDLADELFAPLDPIGRELHVLGREFRVIGVGEKKGSVFGDSRDNYAMIPLTTYHKIVGDRESISMHIQARDPDKLDQAIDETRAIMRARHHLRSNEEDDFGIVTSAGLMDFWEELTAMIFRIAIFVVAISLVVGGIVIMNIMLLCVVERTREIGVRKAIGARHSDISYQFLVESVFLCALGGALGVAAGSGLAWLVRTNTPVPTVPPWWAPVLAVIVTSAIGIFFGLYPAKKAARLDPIEALRAESV